MNTDTASGVGERQQGRAGNQIYVTAAGLPLSIELTWPFHQSTSGADFYVLHGGRLIDIWPLTARGRLS